MTVKVRSDGAGLGACGWASPAGSKGCWAAADGCRDKRPVSDVPEPVSHVCGLRGSGLELFLMAISQQEGIH